jgi:hypothetical protein
MSDLKEDGMVDVVKDAMRYRWLLCRLQEAYDSGPDKDNRNVNVACSGVKWHGNNRRVEATISWMDFLDGPLDLSKAIDWDMLSVVDTDNEDENE